LEKDKFQQIITVDIEKTNEQLLSITFSNVQADMNVKLNVIIFFMEYLSKVHRSCGCSNPNNSFNYTCKTTFKHEENNNI
jgi:hypothetical protein